MLVFSLNAQVAAQKSPSAISEGSLCAGPTKERSGCTQRRVPPLLVVYMGKGDEDLLSDVRDAESHF